MFFLPGYVGVILSLVLFLPDVIDRVDEDDARGISFDLFSAVVLIIAGPAIGYSARAFQRYIYSLLGALQNWDERIRNDYLYAIFLFNRRRSC